MKARFSDIKATKSFLSKEREVDIAWSLGLIQSVKCGLDILLAPFTHPLLTERQLHQRIYEKAA